MSNYDPVDESYPPDKDANESGRFEFAVFDDRGIAASKMIDMKYDAARDAYVSTGHVVFTYNEVGPRTITRVGILDHEGHVLLNSDIGVTSIKQFETLDFPEVCIQGDRMAQWFK